LQRAVSRTGDSIRRRGARFDELADLGCLRMAILGEPLLRADAVT
jgi:hypothetical protein